MRVVASGELEINHTLKNSPKPPFQSPLLLFSVSFLCAATLSTASRAMAATMFWICLWRVPSAFEGDLSRFFEIVRLAQIEKNRSYRSSHHLYFAFIMFQFPSSCQKKKSTITLSAATAQFSSCCWSFSMLVSFELIFSSC